MEGQGLEEMREQLRGFRSKALANAGKEMADRVSRQKSGSQQGRSELQDNSSLLAK